MTDAEKLADAEQALHDLATGAAVRVYVDQNGERIEYTPARMPSLRAYIQDLRAAIAAAESGAKIVKGPLRVSF
jgi:hypothetical protein